MRCLANRRVRLDSLERHGPAALSHTVSKTLMQLGNSGLTRFGTLAVRAATHLSSMSTKSNTINGPTATTNAKRIPILGSGMMLIRMMLPLSRSPRASMSRLLRSRVTYQRNGVIRRVAMVRISVSTSRTSTRRSIGTRLLPMNWVISSVSGMSISVMVVMTTFTLTVLKFGVMPRPKPKSTQRRSTEWSKFATTIVWLFSTISRLSRIFIQSTMLTPFTKMEKPGPCSSSTIWSLMMSLSCCIALQSLPTTEQM